MISYEGQPKTCAYCGDLNHLIALCPKRTKQKLTYSNAVSNPVIDLDNLQYFPAIEMQSTSYDVEDIIINESIHKRVRTSSEEDDIFITPKVVNNQTQPTMIKDKSHEKKQKEDHKFEEYLDPLKDWITKVITPECRLNKKQLCEFLQRAQSEPNLIALSNDYSDRPELFIEILPQIHSKINNKLVKYKINRTIKQLAAQLESEYLKQANTMYTQVSTSSV